MSKILAIVNQKGGVGKTTTTVNLGSALAKMGKSVLLVDMDPQANATGGVGHQPPPQPGVYEVLLGETELLPAVVESNTENLQLLAAHPELSGAEVELVPAIAREYRLKQAFEKIYDQQGQLPWEIVLIDCPPSLGLLTVNALTAANGLLVPLQCEYFALEGLSRLLDTVKLVKGHLNPNLELSGILLTMFDARNNICHQVAEEVTSHFQWDVFETAIPRNVRLSEAPSFGVPIDQYDAECRGATSYRDLGLELLNRLFPPDATQNEEIPPQIQPEQLDGLEPTTIH